MLEKLTLVTGNQNKLREARQILGMELNSASLELQEVQTVNVREAVICKAETAYKTLGFPLLVEDSALTVAAWNGLPGPLVKWFEQCVGNSGMLKMLGADKRQAAAICCIGFHDGKQVHTIYGEVLGALASEERGQNGFGWDRIFIPDGSSKTYAEMEPEQKNSISHRRMAWQQMKKFLAKR